MQNTFSGIEIGRKALIAHQQALNVVGHNLSNASVEGYSRQRIEFSAAEPLYMPQLNRAQTPGQIGQGVMIANIERVKDEILEQRIAANSNGQGYWETRDKYILMLEQAYNEPSDNSVRSFMDRFWTGWQELSMYPTERGAREQVVQSSVALMDAIHNQSAQFTQIRDQIEDDIYVTVKKVNSLTENIAKLNEQIVKVKALGDHPNDLLDQRDGLVRQLSTLINITTDERDNDEFMIHTGGKILVQGKKFRSFELETGPANDGYSNAVWGENKEDLVLTGGKLKSLFDLRDGDVREELQKLDTMTVNFIDMVNEIHSKGWGINGENGKNFFVEYPFVENVGGNYDRNGDGTFDSTYLFRVSGTNVLNPKDHIGAAGQLNINTANGNQVIPYYATDTVEDVISRVNNSNTEINMRLNKDGILEIKAQSAARMDNPDFVIRHLEDSGQFLTGYSGVLKATGAAGAYDWTVADAVNSLKADTWAVAPLTRPSAWIDVNPDIMADSGNVATGMGTEGRPALPGNGDAALAIAQLRNQSVMLGGVTSFDNFFADAVAEIGMKGMVAKQTLDVAIADLKNLTDMDKALSGVNMDEELSNMIKFQHGFNAAAQFISTYTEMIDTIIQRLGV